MLNLGKGTDLSGSLVLVCKHWLQNPLAGTLGFQQFKKLALGRVLLTEEPVQTDGGYFKALTGGGYFKAI